MNGIKVVSIDAALHSFVFIKGELESSRDAPGKIQTTNHPPLQEGKKDSDWLCDPPFE